MKKIIGIVLVSGLFSLLLFQMIRIDRTSTVNTKSFLIIFSIYFAGMLLFYLTSIFKKKLYPDQSGSACGGGCKTCGSKDSCQIDFSQIDLR